MITVYPTKIVIDNYVEGSVPKLERSLSVFDKTIYQYTFSGYFVDEDTNQIIIPGGYRLQKLMELFPRDQFIDKRLEVNPYREVSFSLRFPPRDDLQKDAINFLQINSKQKFLCLPTGKGKTYCSIHYVFKSKKTPMVFVDQENLLEQWKDSILNFTTVKEEEIFIIKGKDSINKLLKMTKKEVSKYKWFITIHRTISKFLDEDFLNMEKLFNHLGIGVKLYDEAHVEMKNIVYVDSLTNTESVYITATPKRSDPIENYVYGNIFHEVPKHIVVDDERYHNVIIVKYNSNPSLEDQENMINRYGFDANKWSKYILQDGKFENFYSMILKLINDVNGSRTKKLALLFHTMEGNGLLHESLVEDLPDMSIGRYDSSIKNKATKESQVDKDLFVTTDKTFGKAIDVKDLSVLINTVPFGSEVMSEQMLGRLRRLNGKEVYYIDCIDVGFERCRKQLNKRRNIYNKIGKKLYEIDLTK